MVAPGTTPITQCSVSSSSKLSLFFSRRGGPHTLSLFTVSVGIVKLQPLDRVTCRLCHFKCFPGSIRNSLPDDLIINREYLDADGLQGPIVSM